MSYEFVEDNQTLLVDQAQAYNGFGAPAIHSVGFVNSHLINRGVVYADQAGVLFEGSGAFVWNTLSGEILGDTGVRLTSDGQVVNDGAINGASFGVALDGADSLANSGTLHGGSAGVIVNAPATDISITNDGEITGARAVRVLDADKVSIVNNGTITGTTAALDFTAGRASIDNFGTIAGDITLGAANDSVRNSGAIHGALYLGAGGDIYDGSQGGVVDFGVFGGDAKDKLTGGDGADALYGGNGPDILKGGAGDDRLNGGRGADALYGGSGADTFVFDSKSDSKLGAPDIIYDFNGAEGDLIDLSKIDADTTTPGNQHFTFQGAFTNAPGQLIEIDSGPQHWALEGDVNGDGQPDFRIDALGVGSHFFGFSDSELIL